MTAGPEGHRERLRQRFERSGLHGFHDHEVLELVLTYVIPRRDVKPIARELLTKFGGNLADAFDAPRQLLEGVDGIGRAAALFLGLIPRLLERYQQDRWKHTRVLSSIKETVDFLASILATERNEVFYVLALNSRNTLIAHEALPDSTADPDRRPTSSHRRRNHSTGHGQSRCGVSAVGGGNRVETPRHGSDPGPQPSRWRRPTVSRRPPIDPQAAAPAERTRHCRPRSHYRCRP